MFLSDVEPFPGLHAASHCLAGIVFLKSFTVSLAFHSYGPISQSACPQQQCTKPLLAPSLARALKETLQSLAESSGCFFTFDYAHNHVNAASLVLCKYLRKGLIAPAQMLYFSCLESAKFTLPTSV